MGGNLGTGGSHCAFHPIPIHPAIQPITPFPRSFGELLRALYGPGRSSLQEYEPPDVIGHRHHRHGEVGSGLTDGADPLAAHLLDGGKDMLDPGADLGDPVVSPFLALG